MGSQRLSHDWVTKHTAELQPASVLWMNIQGWFTLRLTGLVSLFSKGLSSIFSNTTVWKHQFFSALPSLWSSSHIHTWLLERPQPWLSRPLYTDLLLCGSQQTMENSSRDGNTRPPYPPPEKPVCTSRSNSQNQTWNNGLLPNGKRSTSRLYTVTLLI